MSVVERLSEHWLSFYLDNMDHDERKVQQAITEAQTRLAEIKIARKYVKKMLRLRAQAKEGESE